MALLRIKRRWTEENEAGVFWVLHSDALALAGESRCYIRIPRMDLAPDVMRRLSNAEAVELEIDPETLIPSPKESKSTWPHA